MADLGRLEHGRVVYRFDHLPDGRILVVMTIFADSVERHMTATVATVSADDDVQKAEGLLRLHAISSLPVMGRDGDLAGVISFRDLLQAGQVLGRRMGGRTALTLPSACVGDLMNDPPITVGKTQPLADAARIMLDRHVHRVYVVEGRDLVGVLSTNDLLRAVAAGEWREPIGKYASAPVSTVEVGTSLREAVERLASSHVSAFVVVEDDIPCGLFGQLEAIAGKDLPGETAVSAVVEYSVICLPWRTPLSRAAAFAAHSQARRVLAMDGTEMRGILTALDFVRAALG